MISQTGQSNSVPPEALTVRARVAGVPGDAGAHVRLAYAGARSPSEVESMKRELERITMPLEFDCSRSERWTLQSGKALEVRRCSLLGKWAREDLLQFYQRWNTLMPGEQKTPQEPQYEITMQNAEAKESIEQVRFVASELVDISGIRETVFTTYGTPVYKTCRELYLWYEDPRDGRVARKNAIESCVDFNSSERYLKRFPPTARHARGPFF